MDSRKYLNPEERQRFEEYLITHLDTDLRNCCLFLLSLYTGCRPQEALNIQWSDVDLNGSCIHVNTIKRGRPRVVPIGKVIRAALERLFVLCPDRPFNISYGRLNQLWHQYNMFPGKTPHCLRHTFAVNALKTSKELKLVQQALGHKNVANTMIYLDFEYSVEEQRKLMRIR